MNSLITNFKMTVRADCAVFVYNPLPQSIKALACRWGGGRQSAFGQAPHLPPPTLAVSIQNKANFPPIWPLHRLLRGEQPDLPFGYNLNKWNGRVTTISNKTTRGKGRIRWRDQELSFG